MKITKSELKEMIREALREELLENQRGKMVKRPIITEAKVTEADFDAVIKQIKADLTREIKPTPIIEDGEFYEDFKDIYLSWDQWDENTYRKDVEFQIAYEAAVSWVEKHANRYPGFELNFLEPIGYSNDYFITINVYCK